jgi:hypothetical protein
MAFLEINGIPFDVAVDSLTEEVREIGQSFVSFNGISGRTRITTKRDLAFESPLMDATLSRQWERLIRGEHEMWTFSNAYGSKGSGPESGSGSYVVGSGYVSTAFGNFTFYVAPSGSAWTVSFKQGAFLLGAPTTHYTVTSAGKKWQNGVRNDSVSTTFFSVTSGIGTFSGSNNFDNLWTFPSLIDDSWGQYLDDAGVGDGTAYSPKLRITGDAILEGTRFCIGKVESVDVVAAMGTTRRKLVVRLEEV